MFEIHRDLNPHQLADHVADDNDIDCTGYFPGLPLLRERGNYALDNKKEQTLCRKLAAGHKSLLPGIFLIHCPHGMSFCINAAKSN